MTVSAPPPPSDLRADAPVSHAAPPDAFGQQGVLGSVGGAMARLSLIGAIVACVLWNRSFTEREGVLLLPAGRAMQIVSVVGRVQFATWGTSEAFRQFPVPISTRAPQFEPGEDPWKDGIWKTIGYETSIEPVRAGRGRGAVMATVARVRWRTIVVLLLLPPAWHYSVAYLRRRRHEREQAELEAMV